MPSQSIRVNNFVSGSSGFKIAGGGDAEFNDVTVRGALITGSGSQINGNYITAGTITGRTIQTSAGYPKMMFTPVGGGYTHVLIGYDSSGSQRLRIKTDGDFWGSCVRLSELSADIPAAVILSSSGSSRLILSAPLTGTETGKARINFTDGGVIEGSGGVIELQNVSGRFSYSGAQVFYGNCPSSWTDRDLSPWVGSRRALVFLKVKARGGITAKKYKFRTNGDTDEYSYGYDWPHCSACTIGIGECGTVWVMTDNYGKIEWMAGASQATTLWLLAYIT